MAQEKKVIDIKDRIIDKPMLGYDGEQLTMATQQGEPCKECGVPSLTEEDLTYKKALLRILLTTREVDDLKSFELIEKIKEDDFTDLNALGTDEMKYLLDTTKKSKFLLPYPQGAMLKLLS